MLTKLYCEHGALTAELLKMQRDGLVTLLHFPYDPNSQSRRLPNIAAPSAAQIRDLNLAINELPGTLDDYAGSDYYERILTTIGMNHRRDALHVDAAVKSGCAGFLTMDSDILDCRDSLEAFLNLKFYHPVRDIAALQRLVGATSA